VQGVLSASYLVFTDPLVFVLLRAAEGLAAAAVLPSARALIADAIPSEKRGAAYGLFSAFFNAGFLIGPALGGVLATTAYSNAFIGAVLCRIIALFIVLLLVPAAVSQGAAQPTRAQERTARQSSLLWGLPLLGAYVLAFGDYLFLGFDLALLPLWMNQHLGATVAVIGIAYVAWAVPSIVLAPFGGRIADRTRRSRLILIFGLAQVPLYAFYGLADTAIPIIVGFAVQAVAYALVQPAVDAHVAAASAAEARGRVQSAYATIGLAGAFAGASGLTLLYGVNFRLPLFAMGAAYGCCVLVGGLMIRRSEARGLVAGPHQPQRPQRVEAVTA
jgi:MFS family permease